MTDEDYDVIINDKEYKELKENKNKVLSLEKKILDMKQNDQSKNLKLYKIEREVQIQKEEIAFLHGIIQNIGNEKEEYEDQIDELQKSEKSANYQVLGESIMFPKKVNPKQSQLKSSDLTKKYANTIQVVGKIEEKLQSQEALIKKLNQMNSEKDELLLTMNTQKMLEMISDKTGVKIGSLEQLKDSMSQLKNLKEKNMVIQKHLKERTSQCDNLKTEIKKLGQVITTYSQKLNKAQFELGQINKMVKEVPNASSSYGDKPYRIKLLIDQHIKQMQKSLGSVGGLSSQQINSMLSSQLKSLLQYIPKSMDKKK